MYNSSVMARSQHFIALLLVSQLSFSHHSSPVVPDVGWEELDVGWEEIGVGLEEMDVGRRRLALNKRVLLQMFLYS